MSWAKCDKRFRRLKSFSIGAFLSLGIAVLISGCASAKLDSYVSPGFSAGQIHGVAVMPLSNQRIDAGQAIELNRALIQRMQRQNPQIEIIGGQEAIVILNEHDLADTCANFLVGSSTSGLPNTKTLSLVANALNVDGIIQGSIIQVKQEDSDGWSYPITQVSIRYTMFECRTGAVLWELTAEGKIRPYSYSAAPIFEAAKLAHDKLLEKLPL